MVAIEVGFRTPADVESDDFYGEFHFDEVMVVAPTDEQALLEAQRYVAKQGGKLIEISVRDMEVVVVNE